LRATNGVLSSSRAAWAAAGVATLVALVSVWHGAAPTWRKLDEERREFASYSDEQRRDAAAVHAGFLGGVFTALRSDVGDGDRVYFQVPRRPYGTLDLHDTVAALGRFYLAPAVEVTDPADATVVVSFESDPAALGLRYLGQRRLSPEVVVSRTVLP
jgi:hypothetical protein